MEKKFRKNVTFLPRKEIKTYLCFIIAHPCITTLVEELDWCLRKKQKVRFLFYQFTKRAINSPYLAVITRDVNIPTQVL